MAETTNIARMAEILSTKLFSEFFWEKTGSTNINWPCEEQQRHDAKTHPSDVVFYYDNPYSLSRTYVNTDLKSYAAGTIKSGTINSAIESLAKAVNCAEKSPNWQKLFLHEHVNYEVCGLLFVYNHDGDYDKEFGTLLSGVKPKLVELPKKSKIIVFGPDDIFWLDNVRFEIVQMRGNNMLPARDACQFYYPHLTQKKNVQLDRARAANLEMLTSPWIILSHPHMTEKDQRGYVIFYRRRGGSVQEFLYLIDYLMHYQVFFGRPQVRIKTLDTDPAAPALFKKAVAQYIEECDGTEDIKERLNAIEYSQMSQVVTRFSEIEIGMDNG